MEAMARPSAPRLTPRPESQAAHVVAPVADDPHEQVLLTDTQALELLSPGGTSEYSAPRRWRSSEPDSIAAKSPLARESLRGLRAGVEAALVSWLLVTIPVIAAYVATVASPILGEASWWDAARSASAGWLLGLGQAFAVTGAEGATSSVTLTPLALAAVPAALLAGTA